MKQSAGVSPPANSINATSSTPPTKSHHKKQKNTREFSRLKKQNSYKANPVLVYKERRQQFGISETVLASTTCSDSPWNPSRVQFTELHSHEKLTYSPPQFHTVRCKEEVDENYWTAISEQSWKVIEESESGQEVQPSRRGKKGRKAGSPLQWKFRLDKDMRISDLFLGIVLEKWSASMGKNANEAETTHHEGDSNVSSKSVSYDNLTPPFILSNHIGETEHSHAIWCFDTSLWHNNIRIQRTEKWDVSSKESDHAQKMDTSDCPSLGGGVFERIPRGSLIFMKMERNREWEQPDDSSNNTLRYYNLLWRVNNNGKWFGFDGSSEQRAPVAVTHDPSGKISMHVRVGVSFGMPGVQISAMKV